MGSDSKPQSLGAGSDTKTGTIAYNTDLISVSKRTNTYVFSHCKHTKLTYRHLKMNPYEYLNCGTNFIISCF